MDSKQLRARQAEFYEAMWALEEQLEKALKEQPQVSNSAPSEPMSVETSTTTAVSEPLRRRGRPPTGGRKPRNRRKRPEDEEYV